MRVTVKANKGQTQLILNKLSRIQRFQVWMKRPTHKALKIIKERLQQYPPPPAGSTYQRTGDLRSSWHFRTVLSGDQLGRVFSTGVPYAPFVQGYQSQATVHKGRWETEKDVAEAEADTVMDLLENELAKQMGAT